VRNLHHRRLNSVDSCLNPWDLSGSKQTSMPNSDPRQLPEQLRCLDAISSDKCDCDQPILESGAALRRID
jgi:hypothetical protein